MNLLLIGYGNRGEQIAERFDPDAYGGFFGDEIDELHVVDPLITRRDAIFDRTLPGTDVFTYEHVSGAYGRDIDMAIEASNHPRRYETLGRFVDEGIPFICEKPVSQDIESARRLVDRTEETGTMGVSGENMSQHPAYRDAARYLEENSVEVGNIYATWLKNRGPRDHPHPEGITDDLPHPAGLVMDIMKDNPDHINVSGYAEEPAVLNPEKFREMPGYQKEWVNFIEGVADYKGGLLWYNAPCDISFSMGWDEPRNVLANVNASYRTDVKERRLIVSGDAGGRSLDDDFWDNKTSVTVTFTAEGDEVAYEARKGLIGGDTRVGKGDVVERKTAEDCGDPDTLDILLEKFFTSVKNNRMHPDLIPLEQAYRTDVLIERIKDNVGL